MEAPSNSLLPFQGVLKVVRKLRTEMSSAGSDVLWGTCTCIRLADFAICFALY